MPLVVHGEPQVAKKIANPVVVMHAGFVCGRAGCNRAQPLAPTPLAHGPYFNAVNRKLRHDSPPSILRYSDVSTTRVG